MELRKEQAKTRHAGTDRFKSYAEMAKFLDGRWQTSCTAETKDQMLALDKALGNPSASLKKVFVAGTNGKSLTIHFVADLLKKENIACGTYSAPHIFSYRERIAINTEQIPEKSLIELAGEVVTQAETVAPHTSSSVILNMIATVYFSRAQVGVAMFEVDQTDANHPLSAFKPEILTITRVTTCIEKKDHTLSDDITALMSLAKQDTHVITGDQIKTHSNLMQKITEEKQGIWEMPIRKLAALPYPYEQIHGRSAALAERIAQTYVKKFVEPFVTVSQDSFLLKAKGKKGRPTLEAKKQAELTPIRTMDQHWHETISTLPARFQLITAEEKPLVLIDSASNLDAFENVLFGIRLLHYKRALKGIAVVIAAPQHTLQGEEFIKTLRYFAKKTNATIAVCPVDTFIPGTYEHTSWNAEAITNDLKGYKIKAKAFKLFADAFAFASQSVDGKNGLVAITGSKSIIRESLNLVSAKTTK